MKKIRFILDTKVGEVDFKAGDFAEVDGAIADTLVTTGRAEAKTPEEYKAEQSQKALETQRQQWEREKAARQLKVQVIGDVQMNDPKAGFKSFGHFVHDVFKAGGSGGIGSASECFQRYASKAPGSDEMRPDVGSFGGFLVPVEFRNALLKRSLENEIVRPRSTRVPMTSGSIKILAINDISHTTSVHGGIAPAGRSPSDTTQMSGTRPELQQVELTLRELYGMCYVSNSILQWSPISMEPLLSKLFAEAIAFEEDDRFLWGTGAGTPMGVNNAPCLITVDKEAGQSAGSIVAENIFNMYSRMYPAQISNAVWVANLDTFPQLCQLHIKVGTAGVPLWLPGNSASGSPFGTLLGRPLILTEKAQTVGTAGDIMLCAFSEYLIGTAQMAGSANGDGIQTDASIHLRFDYNQTAFRFLMYHDGEPWWSAPLTPRRSTKTVSPFVRLATRA